MTDAVFMAGIARYRLQDYAGALTTFQRNLLLATEPEAKARAYFWVGKAQDGQSALFELPPSTDDEEFAYRILARALEQPMRVIAENAGYSSDVILDRVLASATGDGFDARQGKIVDMQAEGILDSIRVLQRALEVAVSGAAMALTTDVIVHHARPKESIEP